MHEMDCLAAVAKMGEFLDRELSPDEMQRVQRHLEECGECKNAFRWEDSVLKLVKDCARTPAPEGLVRKLIDGLEGN